MHIQLLLNDAASYGTYSLRYFQVVAIFLYSYTVSHNKAVCSLAITMIGYKICGIIFHSLALFCNRLGREEHRMSLAVILTAIYSASMRSIRLG